MLAFSERLFSLLVSPYAYIAVRTWEEGRAIDTVRALATQLKRHVIDWTPEPVAGGGLLDVLDQLEQGEEGTITILRDAHPYLADPAVVRRLRTLEPELAATRRCVVLLSPHLQVPPDLIKDVSVIDAPLPGRIEIEAVLDEVLPLERFAELSRERLVSAALGLTAREATRAFTRARFERQQALRRSDVRFDIEASVIAEKRRLIEADRILEYCELDHHLDDVGGLDALKIWLGERQQAFTAAAAEFGLPVPKGLLLTGVQGCGKSLFAKAVAGFWSVPLLRLDVGRLFDGSTAPEAALSRAIQTAEAMSPAVLWVDEIDKAFGDDGGGSVRRMMGSLLSWLQDKTHPVFFVATANQVDALPPELLRKGRFDEIFFVDLPGESERKDILGIHLTRRGRSPEDYDLTALAKATDHFSGAELEQVVVAGLYKAFAQTRELTTSDLEVATQETVPLYRTYETEIKGLREWAQGRARSAARDRSLLDLFSQNRGGT